MAKGNGFRDSFAELWNSIVEGQGSFRVLRWLILILLIGGIVWSGLLFKKVVDFTKPANIGLPPAKDLAGEDREKLNDMIADFRNSVLSRTGSQPLAVAALKSGRMPLVKTEKPLSAEEMEEIEEMAKAGRGRGTDFVEPEESLPPIMSIRAIMTAGSRKSAIMDIEGEGPAVVVRPGYVFGEGNKGRIVAITTGKVVVNWSGKRIELSAGM